MRDVGFGGLGLRRGSAGFVTLASLLVVLLVGAALVLGTPARSGLIDVLRGRAWLTDEGAGSVMLANGSSAELELRIKVPGGEGADLEVIQVGGQSLLYNRTTGELVSLDLDALDAGASRGVGDVDLVAFEDVLVVVDKPKGVVEIQEPLTGETISKVDLDGPVSRAGIDDDGMIWVVDRAGGDLVGLDFDGQRLREDDRVGLGVGASSELAVADGDPTVVDPGAKELIRVRGGKATSPVRLGLKNGEIPALPRVIDGNLIPIAANTKGDVILVEGDRAQRIVLQREGGDLGLGEPVPFDGRVYVPDHDTGAVIVLDRAGTQLDAAVQGKAGRFSVRVEGGRLWVDYPTGDTAYVLDRGQTRFREIDKQAKVPTKDLEIPDPPTIPEPEPTPTPTPAAGPAVAGGSGDAPRVEASPPGPPRLLTASPRNASATLLWFSAQPNGAPIEHYDVEWTEVGGGETGGLRVDGDLTQAAIGGLANGSTYRFEVTASNSAGTGPPAVSDPVTPQADVPSPPANVIATEALDVVNLTWEAAPAEGLQIVGYDVTAVELPDPSTTPDCSGATQPTVPIATRTAGTAIPVAVSSAPVPQQVVAGSSYGFCVVTVTSNDLVSDPVSSNGVLAFSGPAAVSLRTVRSGGPRRVEVFVTAQWQGREGTIVFGGLGASAGLSASGFGEQHAGSINPAWGTSGQITAQACVDGACVDAPPSVVNIRLPAFTSAPRLSFDTPCYYDPTLGYAWIFSTRFSVDLYGVPPEYISDAWSRTGWGAPVGTNPGGLVAWTPQPGNNAYTGAGGLGRGRVGEATVWGQVNFVVDGQTIRADTGNVSIPIRSCP